MTKMTIIEGNSNDKNNVRVIMVKGERGIKGADGEVAKDMVASLYDTVAVMKSDTTIRENIICQTLGYYNKSDGGGGYYKIRSKTNNDIIDEGFIIEISENLVAELIIENTPKLAQFGFTGKTNDPNYNNDCSSTVTNILANCKSCYIQKGYYVTSNSIIMGDYNQLILDGQGGVYGGTPSDSAVINHITENTNTPSVKITGQGNKIIGGAFKSHQATLRGLIMIDLSNEVRNEYRQMNNNYINTCLYKWEYVAGIVGDGSIGINIYTGDNTNKASGTGLFISGTIYAFDYGIKAVKGTGSSCWLSSIEHNGIIMNCCQSVHLNKMSTGSKFSGIYQPNLSGHNPEWAKQNGNLEFINVQNILVDGFVWDVGGSGNKYSIMVGEGSYDIKYLQDAHFQTNIGYATKSYVISNNVPIIKSNLPYEDIYSNGLIDILSFANKQMLVNYIIPSELDAQTVGQEYYKVFGRDVTARDGTVFKMSSGVTYSSDIEYGYEIIFPTQIRVYDIGVKFVSYASTSNYVRFEGLRGGNWGVIDNLKTIASNTDPDTVFGITNVGNKTAYTIRNDTSDQYKNGSVGLDGIRIIFKGMVNKINTNVFKVWARTSDDFLGASYVSVENENNIYGKTKFISEPILVSPDGTSYLLKVNNDGTLSTSVPGNNPVEFYIYEKQATLNVSETKNIKVALKKCPVRPQTINFVSSDTGVATVTSSLTFTPLNWNIPQEITITPNSGLQATATATITATSLWATQQTISATVEV